MPFADAIGVFDSGVGGLSVLRAIRAALPAEDLVYVADSGHAPYGDKPEAHITQRTLTIGNWLAYSGVKAITVACNTATVVAIRHLREQTHIPVVAIEPAIKPAAHTTRSGVARLCQEHGEGKRILLQACPGWVEAVEQANIHSPQTEALLRQFVEPLMEQGVDTLVLGCTHYPFFRDTLQRIVGQDVVLIDPAVAVATELTRRLGDNRRLETKPIGTTQFFTTGNVAHVQYVVSHLWGDAAIVEAMA